MQVVLKKENGALNNKRYLKNVWCFLLLLFSGGGGGSDMKMISLFKWSE